MHTTKNILLASLVISASFVFTGCGKHFQVSRYPSFYQPDIRDVAVLPFENQVQYKKIGWDVAHHLSAALAANGTYTITGPARLDDLLKEHHLAELPQKDYQAAAKELGQLNEFQALISGRVRSESILQRGAIEDYYGYDYYDGYDDMDDFYPYWYRPFYYEYETEVFLSVDVSVVSVPEGNVLDTIPASVSVETGGLSKSVKRYAMHIAMNDLSEKLVRKLCMVPVKITVHPGKDLKTAAAFQQDRWDFTNTFSRNEDVMYGVLCLPTTANHNQFRLTIVPKGNTDNPVAEKNFTWQGNNHCQGFEFSPKKIAASNGPGVYSLQFYSRGKVIMSRNFKIK